MADGNKYTKIIEWSEQDNCYIGSCPELFYGGCHGDNEIEVFTELCQIVEETIRLFQKDNKPLPQPRTGKELVNSV